MAKETRAQRMEREAAEQAQRLAVARDTFPQRLMLVLERAVNANFELSVVESKFVVYDTDERNADRFFVEPTYSLDNDQALESLEFEVHYKLDQMAEAQRRFEAKQAALNKLTKEERELLGL
jgi:hypothetical protein